MTFKTARSRRIDAARYTPSIPLGRASTGSLVPSASFSHEYDYSSTPQRILAGGPTVKVDDLYSRQQEYLDPSTYLQWSTTYKKVPESAFPYEWRLQLALHLPSWLTRTDLHIAELAIGFELPFEEVADADLSEPKDWTLDLDVRSLFAYSALPLVKYYAGSLAFPYRWAILAAGTLLPPSERSLPTVVVRYASRAQPDLSVIPTVSTGWRADGVVLEPVTDLRP